MFLEQPKTTLDLSKPISQVDFNKYIYHCFQDACLQAGMTPTRALFKETLESSSHFAGFIETMSRKFKLEGFNNDAIVRDCLKHNGA